MRGLVGAPNASSDLEAAARGVLDRRLRPSSASPIAVAVSGGGDSVAAALVASAWAKAHDRPLAILTVDHRLRPESSLWTEQCSRLARRLGASFHPLAWDGEKPLRGLPAAARTARHALLAEAAREIGSRVILLGHTADDVAEAARMRAAGSTTPDPREWSPSPVWPEGRGLFLLRPLLQVGRDAIRGWLRARGERWIEDPANQDLKFARARARALSDAEAAPPSPAAPDGLADLARAVSADEAGVLTLPRRRLRHPAGRAFIAMASLCAAGTTRPPRSDSAALLADRLEGEEAFVATLGGARIEAEGEFVRFLRDPGEAARGGLGELALPPGVAIWDGRFEVVTERPITVRAIGGLRRRLPRAERSALAAFVPFAREGLPTVMEDEITHCPVVSPVPGVTIRALAHERLLAACGAIEGEP